MKLSFRLEQCLRTVFAEYHGSSIITNCDISRKYSICSNMFVIDTSTDNCEIPIFVLKRASYNIHCYNPSEIVVPLHSKRRFEVRTIDSFLCSLFNSRYIEDKLVKVETPKHEIYYGSRGIILDKDFNVLLLCTLSGNKILSNDTYRMEYHNANVYVSPKVFMDTDNFASKAIINKVMPYYLSHNISTRTDDTYLGRLEELKPSVIIKDVNSHIVHPEKPNMDICSQESFNAFLKDHIIDILSEL